ncbi:MAG: hypothetical protein J0I14_12050 [Propionibacteriaceae bacterium]|nr:hypothetical protein [Propionibacteriaceae bacterium]
MAQLTSADTSAGGLGTRQARWAFLFVWACGLAQGFVGGAFTAAPKAWLLVLLCALAGALLLTTPGNRPLRPAPAGTLIVVAGLVAVAGVWLARGVEDLWVVDFAAYLVSFMIVRGNTAGGAVGCMLVLGIVAERMASLQVPVYDWMAVLGIPLGSVAAAVIWRLVVGWIVRQERLHRSEEMRSAERTQAAVEAVTTSQAELAAIRAQVEPLLARVADGDVVDAELRAELTYVEAAVRDRIRAPHLNHPVLVEAIGRLRQSGVEVVVLGEVSAAGSPISDDLAAAVSAGIGAVQAGRVTIRTFPEGRSATASVVIATATATHQLQFSRSGELLRHA